MKSHLFTSSTENEKVTGVFGFDLGTTNSVVTVQVGRGVPKTLRSNSGETTPSCVRYNADGTITIGRPAYRKRQLENVVYSFKKYMGTSHKLYEGRLAREVAADFIRELFKEIKELNSQFANYNGIHVSVPAYFDINQIEDTKLAIKQAGFIVVGVNQEPVSAALIYQQLKRGANNVLVYDLGGGTFDAVIVRNIPGVKQDSSDFYEAIGISVPPTEGVLEIVDIAGNNNLGGDNIDELAVKLFCKANKVTNLTAEQKRELILVAESVKKLTTPQDTDWGDFTYQYVYDATMEVFNETKEIIDIMMKRSKVQISEFVLCGGSTKSTIIRDELSKIGNITCEIDPDLAVGVGNTLKQSLNDSINGLSVINRLAKGVGTLSGGKLKYLAEAGTILPYQQYFTARNSTPFSTSVSIDIYQGDRLTGDQVKISTLILDNIDNHDEEGYATLTLRLSITSDGSINLTVTSGTARIEATLELSASKTQASSVDETIHPDAKFYNKFLKSASHYQNERLTELVTLYGKTGSREYAKDIMALLSELASV